MSFLPPHRRRHKRRHMPHTRTAFVAGRRGDPGTSPAQKHGEPNHTHAPCSQTFAHLADCALGNSPREKLPHTPLGSAQNDSTGNLRRYSGDPHPETGEVTPQPRARPNRGLPRLLVCGPFFPLPWPSPGSRQLPTFPSPSGHIRGDTRIAQNQSLWTRYVTRLCPHRGPPPGNPVPRLVPFRPKRFRVPPGSGLGPCGRGGLPRPFSSLCLNQPSLPLFSVSHFPVTLLSNNFHVQFHFFSSSETSKLSARG